MACPTEPIPAGWRVWRGPMPQPLVQLALDVRARIGRYAYGAIAQTTSWQGSEVAAFKSHHTWTYRGSELLTGICIPGVSLLVPLGAPVGLGAAAAVATDLSTPDPTLAVYAAPEQTDWGLVAVAGGAIALVTGAFLLGLSLASPARR
jgi:hypothetical protein